MILEAVILNIKKGQSKDFEESFTLAKPLISSQKGYLSHELKKCLEQEDTYLLLVQWETVEDHEIGFRGSEAYQEWKKILHHYYDPFPVVAHYQ